MQSPIPLKEPKWVTDFKAFILRGNVVDLAVGIIIGAAFTAIVSSLVADIFNPIIGLLVGGIDFSNIFLTLKGQHEPTLDAAKAAGAVTINIGNFLNAIIKFVIVAFAVFWLVRVLSRFKTEAPPAGPTPSEKLLAEILDEMRKQKGEPVAKVMPAE